MVDFEKGDIFLATDLAFHEHLAYFILVFFAPLSSAN